MSKVYIESCLLWLARLINVAGDYSPSKEKVNTIAYNIILNIYNELEGL